MGISSATFGLPQVQRGREERYRLRELMKNAHKNLNQKWLTVGAILLFLKCNSHLMRGSECMGGISTSESDAEGPDIFSRVWNIYDDYRTSVFYRKYFEIKLSELQRNSLHFDIFTVVGTSTTGIAGWAMWNQPGFQIIWASIAGIAVTMTIIKPILKWNEQLVTYSKLFNAHSKICDEYKSLVEEITFQRTLSAGMLRRHEAIVEEWRRIERLPQGPKSLLQQIQGEVNQEIPFDRFWSPARLN